MSPMPLLEEPEPHGHLMQLYQADEQVLTQNVGRYLLEGLKRGEGLLVIAVREHADAFMRELERLGADPVTAMRAKRLLFLDARETLAKCLVGGQPDWQSFEYTIGTAMLEVRSGEDHVGCRAYGELVALLWESGRFPLAIQLEEFWNKLLESGDFKLFCGYPIDVFGRDFHADSVNALLCAHTHVVPTDFDGDLENAVSRAMDEVMGSEVDDLRSQMKASFLPVAWAAVPAGEAGILWIRDHRPEKADEVAAWARTYYHGERRFRALVENSADAISLIDAHGNLLYASASTTRILGYGFRELVGCNCLAVVHPDDVDRMGRILQDVLATPRCPMHWQARLVHKSKRWCWAEGTATNLLDDPNVRAIVSNYRDITERKTAEEEKEKRAQELVRSNAELQGFAYVAAHDLREPLRTIAAYAQLLKMAQSDEERDQCADIMIGGVTRMAALLDDLLSLTRLEFDDSRHPVDLHRVLDQAIKNLEQAVKESGATLAIDPLPSVQANESHLIEVFQNLISNAIKYRSVAPIEIRVTGEAWEREWLIKVSDNGIGIAPNYHDQIFGLFKRLHGRNVPGTGLGLAICRKIVEGMGGKIWVDSKPGTGSTFCFTIARDMTTDGSEPDAESEIRSSAGGLV
jgi:PAS domain S-box-containing protein